jgi:hypothetical protein
MGWNWNWNQREPRSGRCVRSKLGRYAGLLWQKPWLDLTSSYKMPELQGCSCIAAMVLDGWVPGRGPLFIPRSRYSRRSMRQKLAGAGSNKWSRANSALGGCKGKAASMEEPGAVVAYMYSCLCLPCAGAAAAAAALA